MKECCGSFRKTPFCPSCGKPTTGDPVVQLLAYLRKQLKAKETNLEMCRRQGWADHENRVTLIVQRWQSWITAVETLIASQGK